MKRTTTLTPKELEEWYANQPPQKPKDESFVPLLPIVRKFSATTLGGGGWVKSKKNQLKEDRINKLRKLQGKKPNVKLEKDIFQEGLVSVQPLSAPTGNLFFIDYVTETEEEKRKKKQKARKEKLESLEGGVDFIKNLQLNIIRKEKLKYIDNIIKNI